MRGFGPEKRVRNRQVTFGPAERSRAEASSAIQIAEGAFTHPRATVEYIKDRVDDARCAVAAVIERPSDPNFLTMIRARLQVVVAKADAL